MAAEPAGPARAPFKVGEQLSFSVNWTVGNIGRAEMTVAAIDTVQDQAVYRIQAGARSNKTLDLIYPVRDYFVSMMDRDQLFSRRFFKQQKEGKHERQRKYIYDQEALKRYELVKGDTSAIVPEAQDELSIFYYFRTLDFVAGQGLLLENYVDKEGNPLKVKILGTEWVEVPAGRFFCWVVEPYIKSGGLFEHKGNLQIWITHDQHRIPVKMSSNLDIGKIVVLLESFKLGDGQPVAMAGQSEFMRGID